MHEKSNEEPQQPKAARYRIEIGKIKRRILDESAPHKPADEEIVTRKECVGGALPGDGDEPFRPTV